MMLLAGVYCIRPDQIEMGRMQYAPTGCPVGHHNRTNFRYVKGA